jgi:hypothetical protein
LITHPLHKLAGWLGKDKVGAEEGKLNQRSLHIIQQKNRLQMRDQHIVEDRAEPPYEEQRCHHRHGAVVGRVRRGKRVSGFMTADSRHYKKASRAHRNRYKHAPKKDADSVNPIYIANTSKSCKATSGPARTSSHVLDLGRLQL